MGLLFPSFVTLPNTSLSPYWTVLRSARLSIILCEQNAALRDKIEQFAEELKSQAHTLGSHGLDEREFYSSGLFRGAVERIRGQFSATMGPKREFVKHVLNHMEDRGFISSWDLAEASERSDYWVGLPSGKNAVIALTGAMDGNNTTIFERPSEADEFVIWSMVTNPGSDPRRNAWSGVHTRLSAEMVSRNQQVDGLIIWDMVCGTLGRPCPKLVGDVLRLTEVGPYRLPPACLYMFPAVPPGPNNTNTKPQALSEVELMAGFHLCFGGNDEELNEVSFSVEKRGGGLYRRTTVERGGDVQKQSGWIPIRRS